MEKIYSGFFYLSKLILIIFCTNAYAKYISIDLKKGGTKVLKFYKDISKIDTAKDLIMNNREVVTKYKLCKPKKKVI